MTDPGSVLREKLSDLRRWERRKRRERLLLESLCYTALAAAALASARALFPVDPGLLWWTPAVFAGAAAGVFLLRPWREQALVGSLRQVDRALHLQERALTAWEILRRSRERGRPEEDLVVEEAAEKLAAADFRPLLRRRFTWHAWAAPLLALAAAGGLWLPRGGAPEASSASARAAQEVREHARELGRRAREQDLAESLRTARALRELADRHEAGADESHWSASVGAMAEVLEEMARPRSAESGIEWPGLSDAALAGLRERLRRSETGRPDGSFEGRSRSGLLESMGLSSLDRFPGRSADMSEREVREFLDRIHREAREEQDRRSLAATREFLAELVPGDAPGESTAEAAAPGAPDGVGEDGTAAGRRPGDEPARGGGEPFEPAFQARVRTHLRGLLGQGPSRGFGFRGEARPGGSEVEEEAVVARYRRQAEADLSTAEIPAEFKETIKSYFLSLGVARERP